MFKQLNLLKVFRKARFQSGDLPYSHLQTNSPIIGLQ